MQYIFTNARAIKILNDYDSYYVYRGYYFPCFEDQDENSDVYRAVNKNYYLMRNWPEQIPSHYRMDTDDDSYTSKKLCALSYINGIIDVKCGYSFFTWQDISCHDSSKKYVISNATLIVNAASYIANAYMHGISVLKKWTEFCNQNPGPRDFYMLDDFDRIDKLYKTISEIPMETVREKMKEVFTQLNLGMSTIFDEII